MPDAWVSISEKRVPEKEVRATVTSDRILSSTFNPFVSCTILKEPFMVGRDVRGVRNAHWAYTTEDHTGYTITTAGSEGMLEILPTFLDHILYPTLRPSQFLTEVYHLDGEAKHQGVVYCEMASREHTEADM
ncbi:Presequence protease, mitochondrial, partial [Quaeritorhiza haematococci]